MKVIIFAVCIALCAGGCSGGPSQSQPQADASSNEPALFKIKLPCKKSDAADNDMYDADVRKDIYPGDVYLTIEFTLSEGRILSSETAAYKDANCSETEGLYKYRAQMGFTTLDLDYQHSGSTLLYLNAPTFRVWFTPMIPEMVKDLNERAESDFSAVAGRIFSNCGIKNWELLTTREITKTSCDEFYRHDYVGNNPYFFYKVTDSQFCNRSRHAAPTEPPKYAGLYHCLDLK